MKLQTFFLPRAYALFISKKHNDGMVYKNRYEAGRELALDLYDKYRYQHTALFTIPRGGVPLGYEVSRKFDQPFEVVVSHKLGAPGNPQFGVGAVSEEGVIVLNEPTIKLFDFTLDQLERSLRRERNEVERDIMEYRQGRRLPDLSRRIVILIDDGLATGVTAKAAIQALERHNPQEIIFAAPICEGEIARTIEHMVDDIVCLNIPSEIQAVSLWYSSFDAIPDNEVIKLLSLSQRANSLFL